MAVRLLTIEDVEAMLVERGCVSVGGWRDHGRAWRRGNVFFFVPLPELPPAEPPNDHWEKRRYPDWLIFEMIDRLNLPAPQRDDDQP